mmetsp:Transcript_16007/g.26848  ORF Transcript_16007/g.26848 Transcript_16007/m.26848 type:complete len:371 (+) Transcript_16007:189-1301(+)
MDTGNQSLPSGWEEHVDPGTGAIFYYHAESQTSTWDLPEQARQTPPRASLSHKQAISQALDQLFEEEHEKKTLPPLHKSPPYHKTPPKKLNYHHQQPQPFHPQQQQQQPYPQQFYHQQAQPYPQQFHYQQQQQPYSQQFHHQQPLHQQSHHQQLPQLSMEPKRTTVKIKSKTLSGVLGNKNKAKVHVQDEEDPSSQHQSSDLNTSTAVSSNTSSKEIDNDPPVGGKSQDYLGMIQIYNLQRPFLDRSHNINCVLCQRVVPEDVFFPCEHKVVCRGCIQKEQVCPDYDLQKFPNGHCNCPLCAAIIKLILPNENGKEVEKYWSWVLAVKPELPQGFLRDFRHSAAIIQKVHIDENIAMRKRREKKSCCTIS